MAVGNALDIALQAIIQAYDESDMNRFHIEYSFVPSGTTGAILRTSYWQFSFRNDTDSTDVYDVILHTIDGEVFYIAGSGESIG
jgi:hypothetical protein